MSAAQSLLAVLACATTAAAQQSGRVLDHDAYDAWLSIDGERISDDGAWVLYALEPRVGDAELVVRRPGGSEHRVPRASDARFSPDSRFALFTIEPAHDSVRSLRLAETDQEDMPGDTLGILELATGEVTRIPDVRSWELPAESGAVVAYLLDSDRGPAPAEPEPDTAVAEPGVEPRVEPGVEPRVEPGLEPGVEPREPGAGEDPDESEGRDKPDSYTMLLRDLATGSEHRYPNVVAFELSPDGERLAYSAATDDGAGDGVFVVATATGLARPILSGEGLYEALVWSEDGRRVAFVSDRDDPTAEPPSFTLYHWREGAVEAGRVAAAGTAGIPDGWVVSRDGTLRFSESGERLFFGTTPYRGPAPEDSLLDEEKVELDVWHWRDPHLQPMQLVNADDEAKRAYEAVAHLDGGGIRVVQLATPETPEVDVASDGDGDVALAESGVAYRHLVGIESPGYSDIWLVDVADGSRRRVVENRQVAWARISRDGRYAAWYDYADRVWHGVAVADGRVVPLSSGIPYPVWDEEDDHPMLPGPYGAAGWTEDGTLLVYDRFDVWALDPTGRRAPRSITEGYGRENRIRLRHVELDPDDPTIDERAPLLFSAFHVDTKESGFFRDRVAGTSRPERLVFEPKRFGRPVRAEDAGALLFTREDVSEFPDLWVSDAWLGDARRISDANPQRSEYNWATVELVEWLSTEGAPLQGLLYKPEDFDPSRKYPMLVYFYERSSDNLHQHAPPLPHRSVIRPTFYASRGYVVFIPDIVYQEGYPGESAMESVMPGTLKLAAEPWVDEENVGVQGHSWGGYQIAYMVTRTDFFKAAEAGAPVANMTSAYGGIRWGSGMSRMFQYERTQSRIGASLWAAPMRYLENSPLFFLDRVETPLLIMHNDGDTAVPWYQGIELFVALRRLGKPAWLINYNDQPHWPVTAANIRDWNIRMQQFFDHYLQGAPPPVWLVEGIPATQKGRTLGLELVDPAIAVERTAENPAGGSR